MPGKTLNRAQLAETCGVSLVTVDNWVREGCPYIKRPGRKGVSQWEFSPAAVFEWRIERERRAVLGEVVKIDETEARRRKLAAEAGLAELELAKANGACVSIEDAQRASGQMIGAARAKLLSMPNKLCRLVAIESDVATCESLLRDSVEEALAELAAGLNPAEEDEIKGGMTSVERARTAVEVLSGILSAARKISPKLAAECERVIEILTGRTDGDCRHGQE